MQLLLKLIKNQNNVKTDHGDFYVPLFFQVYIIKIDFKKYPLLNQHFLGWTIETKMIFLMKIKLDLWILALNNTRKLDLCTYYLFQKTKPFEYTFFLKRVNNEN